MPKRSAADADAAVAHALSAVDSGTEPAREELAAAVRHLAKSLAERAPGKTVELRIPPYVAVQCVAGPRHTRGTPPNVVQADPVTWLLLATGRLSWAAATRDGRVHATGGRADLSTYLPVTGGGAPDRPSSAIT